MLLTSSETWFRPSDVCVAPDGSIFVADWYDKNVGGHAMNDPQDGRIYRLTPKGHKGYKVPEAKLDTKDGVLAALASPNNSVRHIAQNAFSALSRDPFLELGKLIWNSNDSILIGRTAEAMLRRSSNDVYATASMIGRQFKEPQLKQLAHRQLSAKLAFSSTDFLKGNLPVVGAENVFLMPPSVRREALLGLRLMPTSDTVIDLFFKLASHYDGEDIFYRAALNIACGTDPKRRDEILADFDKHFPEWNDKVADLVWELRPKSVLPRLPKLLTDAKLTDKQKARVLDIIVAYDDASAGAAMLDVLKTNAPAEVKCGPSINCGSSCPPSGRHSKEARNSRPRSTTC